MAEHGYKIGFRTDNLEEVYPQFITKSEAGLYKDLLEVSGLGSKQLKLRKEGLSEDFTVHQIELLLRRVKERVKNCNFAVLNEQFHNF